jgi:hypothetical protein
MRLSDRGIYCLAIFGTATAALVAKFEPALAFARPPRGAPGPLIGMGLPLAAVVVAGLAVAGRFRRSKSSGRPR